MAVDLSGDLPGMVPGERVAGNVSSDSRCRLPATQSKTLKDWNHKGKT